MLIGWKGLNMTTIDYSGAAGKYKFNVFGKADDLLKAVGKFASTDSSFSAYKRKRINEQKEIQNSGDFPAVKSTMVELNFLKDSLRMVKTAFRGDRSVGGVDKAIQKIAKEVADLAVKYNGMNMSARTADNDDYFQTEMNKMLDDLSQIQKQQSIVSRGTGKVYNSTLRSTEKYINQARGEVEYITIAREDFDRFAAAKAAKNDGQSLNITV